MENIEQKLSELKTALEAATEKKMKEAISAENVSYKHLRAHETSLHLVCRLLLAKKHT